MSRFLVFIASIFFAFPANGNNTAEKCGTFSDRDLVGHEFLFQTRLHKYLVIPSTFVDGWKKLAIFPLSNEALDSYRRNESSVPFHIAQCICGFNPKVGFLHVNPDSQFVYRYRCDTGSTATDYRAEILSSRRISGNKIHIEPQ